MKAKVLHDVIALTVTCKIEGETILETTCRDFDHYISLPDAVEYQGVVCSKTGWSSDRGYACYKSGGMLARKVR
jgi:hypothetical protein